MSTTRKDLERLQLDISDERDDLKSAFEDRDQALVDLRSANDEIEKRTAKVAELEAKMQQELAVERKRADMVKQ